jgi:hypothetical protein
VRRGEGGEEKERQDRRGEGTAREDGRREGE